MRVEYAPARILDQARYPVVPSTRKYTCVETVDRSYFSRNNYNPLASAPPCERLSAERKKGRPELRLDATDRLRVEVTVTQGSNGNGRGLSGQGHDELPLGTFFFPGRNPQFAIPVGFKSKWRTVEPASKKAAESRPALLLSLKKLVIALWAKTMSEIGLRVLVNIDF
jgi:hypothetical protein